MLLRLRFSRRLVLAALTLAAGIVIRTAFAAELPPVESWGDLQHPYEDSLAVAAERALDIGPGGSFTGGLYRDYFSLDMREREARGRAGRALYDTAISLQRTARIDSLELHLAALLRAPDLTPASVQAGRILLQRGDSGRAKPLLLQAIRLEPREEALWVLLGEVYRRGGLARKARLAFEQALHLGGGSSERTNAREALALLFIESGELARADSLLQAAPGASPAWLRDFVQGQWARQKGDRQAAREALQRATSHPQAPAAAFIELAKLEQERGALDAAERAYRQALHIAPHEGAAHTGLGLVQMARGDVDGAAARFAARVRVDPADDTAQFNLGRALLQIAATSPGRADSACAAAELAFAACLAAGYAEPGARLGRAQARWGQGNLDGAAADARRLLDVPTHAERARLLLARVALTQGKPQEVLEYLQPLHASNELDGVGLAMLGKAYLELGEPEKAIAALQEARAASPGMLHVDTNYAVALSQAGRLEEAETVLRQLVVEHPDDSAVLQNLAAVLSRQGRDAEAEALLQRIEAAPR